MNAPDEPPVHSTDGASTHTRGITAHLAALAAGDFPGALAAPARAAARRHFMDTTGAVIAGMGQPLTQRVAQLHGSVLGEGAIKVPGSDRRWDVLTAAYLMGTAAHGLELDDGYTAGSVHPGVTVVPALLAAVQMRPTSGARLLTAVIVGYEVVAQLAQGVHPASRRRGFHNTAIVGPIAAAAAVGSLFGMAAATIEQAMGLAASSASGLFAFLHSGGDTKRLHAGHAAREGVLAALLAEGGMHGPAGVIESRDGFVQAFGDPARSSLMQPPADIEPAIMRCYIKPWACCRHLHPALHGILDIVQSDGVRAADVARVDIATYAIAASHAGTGWSDLLSAQMSYPFVVAVGLARGHADLDDFGDQARADAAVTNICPRIFVAVDAGYDASYPRTRMARVTVRMRDGNAHERIVDDGYGSPALPMDAAALARKFENLVSPVLGAPRATALRAAFESLDDAPDSTALVRLLGA
jgi:2-methylcitrate dehydratase PrpD